MAIEKIGQMTYVDKAGNEYLLFPKTKAECVEGLTPEAVGAAPAGCGLGDMLAEQPMIADAHEIWKTGWYRVHPSVTANVPVSGVLRAEVYAYRYVTLTLYSNEYLSNDTTILRQCLVDGVWQDWEFFNPPMVLGVEYRTTERCDGKAVYKKKVSVGALPNATVKTFTHLIHGFTCVVDYQLTGYSGDAILHPTDVYYFNTTYAGITLNATSDLSPYSGIAYLAYIKD